MKTADYIDLTTDLARMRPKTAVMECILSRCHQANDDEREIVGELAYGLALFKRHVDRSFAFTAHIVPAGDRTDAVRALRRLHDAWFAESLDDRAEAPEQIVREWAEQLVDTLPEAIDYYVKRITEAEDRHFSENGGSVYREPDWDLCYGGFCLSMSEILARGALRVEALPYRLLGGRDDRH